MAAALGEKSRRLFRRGAEVSDPPLSSMANSEVAEQNR